MTTHMQYTTDKLQFISVSRQGGAAVDACGLVADAHGVGSWQVGMGDAASLHSVVGRRAQRLVALQPCGAGVAVAYLLGDVHFREVAVGGFRLGEKRSGGAGMAAAGGVGGSALQGRAGDLMEHDIMVTRWVLAIRGRYLEAAVAEQRRGSVLLKHRLLVVCLRHHAVGKAGRGQGLHARSSELGADDGVVLKQVGLGAEGVGVVKGCAIGCCRRGVGGGGADRVGLGR